MPAEEGELRPQLCGCHAAGSPIGTRHPVHEENARPTVQHRAQQAKSSRLVQGAGKNGTRESLHYVIASYRIVPVAPGNTP